MDIRRIKVGDKRYKLKPLKKEQKQVLSKNHLIADDWFFVSETDFYLRVVRKDSLEGNLEVKTIYK